MNPFRILLVDDDPASRAKTEKILAGARYEVSSCSDFPVAARLLKAMKGRAVVVAPLEASGDSAIEFVEQSQKGYPHLPFILFATRPTVADVTKAMRAGAHDFLRKPVSPEMLLESVARSASRLHLSLDAESGERESRAELSSLRAELKRIRSQCAFKGFMISMAAHDFRSVLTVLDGYHQIILQNCDRNCGKEIPVKMLEQTGRTIFRLQSMAGTLFDVEAAEKGELRIAAVPFDYDELLRECASFYRPYAAQKRVDLDIEDPLPRMRALGDPARVLQIFDNLLYNAVKFTPADGSIRIGGGPRENGYVTATVRDTGNGLPKNLVKELMGESPASVRSDQDARVGMGLTICRRLVASQNGKFHVANSPDKGTVINISLPAETST